METRNVTAGVFSTHESAEEAVSALETSGVVFEQISLAGRDCSLGEHVSGYFVSRERMHVRGRLERFWNALSERFSHSASYFVPGIGQMMLYGPLVEWVNSALDRGRVVGGLSAAGAALFGIGLPKECLVRYEEALRSGRFLVVAHGTADEAGLAREILNRKSDNDAVVYRSSVPH